jgi:hypothetical protein
VKLIPQIRDREGHAQKYRRAALEALAQTPGANALIDVKLSAIAGSCARVEGKPVRLH